MPVFEHLVQFYDSEPELVRAVVPFLARGLEANESVLVIATQPHREAFERELAALVPGFEHAVSAGGYTSIDAAEVLLYLRDGDRGGPSADDFDATIGALVRRHLAKGRPLRAYGEIVALLWDEGDAAGAMALEEMWNQLQAQEEFTLFCGYPGESSPHRLEAVRQVCRAHSEVLPAVIQGDPPLDADAAPISASFSASIESPGRVRELLRSTLRKLQVDEDLIERGTLAASELAANAVIHARTPFRLLVRPTESSVWIGVEDGAPLADRLGVVGRSPHGLALVAALASRWGISPVASGKLVWAEIPH